MKLIKKGLMDNTTSSSKIILAFLIVGIIYALIFIFFITETKIETIDRETVYVISRTMRWIAYAAIGMVAIMLITYAFSYLYLVGRLEKIDFEKEGRKCLPFEGGAAIVPFVVGMWLSLVEYSVRDAGVAGSNPAIPTILNTHKAS